MYIWICIPNMFSVQIDEYNIVWTKPGKTSMVLGMIFWGNHRFNCARLPEGMTFDKVVPVLGESSCSVGVFRTRLPSLYMQSLFLRDYVSHHYHHATFYVWGMLMSKMYKTAFSL